MHVALLQDYDAELSAELERTLLYDERGHFNEALLTRPPDTPPDAGLYKRPDPDMPFRPVKLPPCPDIGPACILSVWVSLSFGCMLALSPLTDALEPFGSPAL